MKRKKNTFLKTDYNDLNEGKVFDAIISSTASGKGSVGGFFFFFPPRLIYLLSTKKSEALNCGDILLLNRSSLAAANIKTQHALQKLPPEHSWLSPPTGLHLSAQPINSIY